MFVFSPIQFEKHSEETVHRGDMKASSNVFTLIHRIVYFTQLNFTASVTDDRLCGQCLTPRTWGTQ